MSNIEQIVTELLQRNGFDCAAIADREGRHITRLGQFNDETCVSALARDFFDPNSVVALANYLEGKPMPQMASKGKCWVLSGFLPDGRLLSMYGHHDVNVRVEYEKSQKIWNELSQLSRD